MFSKGLLILIVYYSLIMDHAFWRHSYLMGLVVKFQLTMAVFTKQIQFTEKRAARA